MANAANLPYANALAKQFPAPEGIKIFTAGENAKKMLAFWSVKQSTKTVVLRVGDNLVQFSLHSCPYCEENLSAQVVKLSQEKRDMVASLLAMLKAQEAAKAPSAPAPKKAPKAPKQATVQAQASTEEEEALAELDRLTQPGGAQ